MKRVYALFMVFIGLILMSSLFSSRTQAASGDRHPAAIAKFQTISSSTKRTCTLGEMRLDRSYVYVCYSTGSGKWKRITLGNPF